jgi:uncharacterized protein YdeI (YjbR/CyaY-like superfamily)
MRARIFSGPSEFREWLERNHGKVQELLVGIYNQRSSETSITYREALDEALCFGWIDGVRRSVNETTYCVRFTPRKARSYWSAVNIKRFGELKKQGRLAAPVLEAFEKRSQDSGKYSFENRTEKIDPAFEKQFQANKRAWEFFSAQAPWYRRTSAFWVMSAKKDETRLKRLGILMKDSENGKRLGMLTPKGKKARTSS